MAQVQSGVKHGHIVGVHNKRLVTQNITPMSEEIHEIFKEYTDIIEPLSLDEAYLDVTEVNLCNSSASLMAKELREKIFGNLNSLRLRVFPIINFWRN